MGGAAPVVDSSGNIWVSTGNGSVTRIRTRTTTAIGARAVLVLRLLQFFAPTTWATNNSQDLDMSTAPVLLPDGQVVLAGKSRIVYLLSGAHLGGIGGQQATRRRAHAIIGGLRQRHRRRHCHGGHDGLPAAPAASSRSGSHSLRRASPALEFRNRRRASHHRRGPGLDDRAERQAVRARSARARCVSRWRSARRRTISRRRAWVMVCCWPRARTTLCLRRASVRRRDDPGRRRGAAHGLPGLCGAAARASAGRDMAAIALGALVVTWVWLVRMAVKERWPLDSEHQFAELG